MNKRAKLYPNPNVGPKMGYKRFNGVDGFSHNNGDFAFSENLDDWKYGKRKGKKQSEPLF